MNRAPAAPAAQAGLNDADTARPWHAADEAAVLATWRTDPQRGLSAAQCAAAQARHGLNALPEAPPQPAWRVLLRQFNSPLIYILLVAAALALALGHQGDAGVILLVVGLNSLVGAWQEGRAERSMAALRQLAALQVRVWRDGAECRVAARELVPGDLLLLAAGDAVGADARLIEASQLQVAEAALTGESVPVAKRTGALDEAAGLADRHNMVHSGTHVTAGRARAVVVATGGHTEVGRIARLTTAARDPVTPLEARIAQFGRALVLAALGLFALVMALGLWRGLPLAEVLMVAISQMVSMVPEGLPVAMTIALAVGMQRMAGRGAIIRRLSAVETLGSTTVICSDKTGTLTRNQMTVVQLWCPAGPDGGPPQRLTLSPPAAVAPGTAGALQATFRRAVDDQPVDPARAPGLHALLVAGLLCNDADLQPGPAGSADLQALGDPTESALLLSAAQAGLDVAALRAQAPREAEQPFDSDTQRMATRHRLPDGRTRVCIKGAPEAVLRLTAPHDPETARLARHEAEAMAGAALRVLAVAVLDDVDPADSDLGLSAVSPGPVHLLGLVGQIDPPREEARAAVAACQAAGIRPVMVTGDHKLTGLAIARSLGLARPGDRAMDGAELERLGEADLREALPGIAVFARVQPAQKLRIVEALQARGEVVAMTGDGVNDAPALARADVGVAMGITGTEVAKSAAKIVLTDDNFATLVGAVEQGRVVYGNLKKVIVYLFATSIDEVVVLMLALLAGLPLPLAAVQILWINLVTEGTLTINLVMDPPDGTEMDRAPVPRDDPLIDRAALARIALMASAAVAATFGWFAWRHGQGVPLDALRTETFTVLAMCQWFNVLNCQSATGSALRLGVLRNRWLLGGLLASVLLQGLVIWAPWMNTLFHTVPLTLGTVVPMVLVASGVLWVEELRKLAARRRVRRSRT